ncbi:hypothetical protein PRZ48_014275 [Zasmidium cellare]|uniref:Uncharacterized protein n=1 Tax=Zasmidium cellare TaxID=395010 RepID=A0ABR0E0H7_ZASCE|nr:hypothetical protein PRZ48_014275 [Zasmidium cellare]
MSANSTSASDDWSLYPYNPNKAAPIAFAIIMSLLGCVLAYQNFHAYRWKRFGGMMLWATLVWVAGFISRAISVRHTQSVGIFIAQFVMILMGPPLYAAAEYFILGRLFAYLPYHTPIHPGRVFSTFAILSAAVEALTGSGAANSAGNGRDPGARRVGLDLLKAALILQCCVEVGFLSLVGLLEYRCRKARVFPKKISIVCYVLYVTSLMMLLRCVVRAVEGFEAAACDPDRQDPYCGPVSRNEWFLWTFEVANITLFVILLCIFHPGRYLPRSSKIFLDPIDGKTERLGPGFSKADKRPLLITILDPFNFYGILSGKGMVFNKFWEEYQPIYTGKEEELRPGHAGLQPISSRDAQHENATGKA